MPPFRIRRAHFAAVAVPLLAVLVTGCGGAHGGSSAADTFPTDNAPAQVSGVCGTRTGPAPRRFAHVVWIQTENHDYPAVVGNKDAPYVNALAADCGLATNYHSVTLGDGNANYFALSAGQTFGITKNADPATTTYRGPSLFSQLGGNWRTLAEDEPKPYCQLGNVDQYHSRHTAAVYYADLRPICASHVVPLTGAPDLSAAFTWIIPGLCHMMHNGPGCTSNAAATRTGDDWFRHEIPVLVNTPQYRAGNTLIVITCDEGDKTNHITTLVLSPYTRPGTRSALPFTHYSTLKTTEELLGLPLLGHAADPGLPDLVAAFNL